MLIALQFFANKQRIYTSKELCFDLSCNFAHKRLKSASIFGEFFEYKLR